MTTLEKPKNYWTLAKNSTVINRKLPTGFNINMYLHEGDLYVSYSKLLNAVGLNSLDKNAQAFVDNNPDVVVQVESSGRKDYKFFVNDGIVSFLNHINTEVSQGVLKVVQEVANRNDVPMTFPNSIRNVKDTIFNSSSKRHNFDFNGHRLTVYVFENEIYLSYTTVSKALGLGTSYVAVRDIIGRNENYNKHILIVNKSAERPNQISNMLDFEGVVRVARAANNRATDGVIKFLEDVAYKVLDSDATTKPSTVYEPRATKKSVVASVMQADHSAAELSVAKAEKEDASLKTNEAGLVSLTDRIGEMIDARIKGALNTDSRTLIIGRLVDKIETLSPEAQVELIKSVASI